MQALPEPLVRNCGQIMHRSSMQIAYAAALAASLLASLAWTQPLAAQPCDDLGDDCPVQLHSDTARGAALATGQRASAMSTSALAYNPAALVLGKLYHIEGSVDYLPAFNTVALGGAVVDSSTSRVGAGIAFRGFISGDTGIGGIDGRVALAFPFTDAISIGLGGRYINLDYDSEMSDGMDTSRELVEGFTMDASLRLVPAPGLSLAALAVNFIDLDSPYAPVLVGGAAAYTFAQIATVGLDLLFDLSSFSSAGVTLGGSGEVLIAQLVPVRLGYGVDLERDLHTLAGGIGYTDRRIGFDISFQQQVSGGDDTRVIGAFRYYVR
jgi:hypothetical protein